MFLPTILLVHLPFGFVCACLWSQRDALKSCLRSFLSTNLKEVCGWSDQCDSYTVESHCGITLTFLQVGG